MILGRRGERETIDQLIAAVRSGQGRALVVRGEAGVGKTALVDHLVEHAAGCRVIRVVGIQSEMRLAFAALHQLCAPMMDRLPRLPEPQRDAIRTTFGLQAGTVPEQIVVGLGVLSLLAGLADERPVVCVIDDAHWLDGESLRTLTFAARRLLAEPVALVFATRPSSHDLDLAGLPELVVGGLDDVDAATLLESVVPAPLDPRVRDRIVAETRGNPLAILELPREMTYAEIASGLPPTSGLASEIEGSYQRRLRSLPARTRQLLLIAAAEPFGDQVLIWRAAQSLSVGSDDVSPAVESGLCVPGAAVMFRHPLVRSAVYRSATRDDRRAVHRALADVTSPDAAPDRHAWHRAHGAAGPDEDVAVELEHAGGRALARGSPSAAAALLEQATLLTPDSTRRARRALDAARVHSLNGDYEPALALLVMARAGSSDEALERHVDLLHAQVAFAMSRSGAAATHLLGAIKRLEPIDPGLARVSYLEAFSAAIFAGRLASGVTIYDVAQQARLAQMPTSPEPGASDLLLDALAVYVTDGRAAGIDLLRRALDAHLDDEVSEPERLPWLWLACVAAASMWDHRRWDSLSARHVEIGRASSALSELPNACMSRIFVLLFGGDLSSAARLVEESATVTEATGTQIAPYGAIGLAAWRGDEELVRTLLESHLDDTRSRGEASGVAVMHYANALLANSLGRYEDAFVAARDAVDLGGPLDSGSKWGLVELVEAATRSGRPDAAADAVEEITRNTRPSGTDWALGIEARARALVSEGPDAERLYADAIERLGRVGVRADLARAHLLYGEWLRRSKRRLDARTQLATAHEMFTAMGSIAFAERAARELRSTGTTVRRRTVETLADLTPQEAQIARFASEGLSNPEIASRLFLSPRTVEYHLHKVFAKLHVTSRTKLRTALSQQTLPTP